MTEGAGKTTVGKDRGKNFTPK